MRKVACSLLLIFDADRVYRRGIGRFMIALETDGTRLKRSHVRDRKKLQELALSAQSAEEIAQLAQDAGIELADGDAERLFERLHGEGMQEIADDELGSVAGGACKGTRTVRPGLDKCGHGFCACFSTCKFYKAHDDDPNVGECGNPGFTP